MGLKNLGNSCYMNSVLQVLWALPEMHERYTQAAAIVFKSAPPEAASDFAAQFAKVRAVELPAATKHGGDARTDLLLSFPHSQVGVALLTGKTGAPPASGVEQMEYEKEMVTTEGGLEAVVEVSIETHCTG